MFIAGDDMSLMRSLSAFPTHRFHCLPWRLIVWWLPCEDGNIVVYLNTEIFLIEFEIDCTEMTTVYILVILKFRFFKQLHLDKVLAQQQHKDVHATALILVEIMHWTALRNSRRIGRQDTHFTTQIGKQEVIGTQCQASQSRCPKTRIPHCIRSVYYTAKQNFFYEMPAML